jgi:hypothetical protein
MPKASNKDLTFKYTIFQKRLQCLYLTNYAADSILTASRLLAGRGIINNFVAKEQLMEVKMTGV